MEFIYNVLVSVITEQIAKKPYRIDNSNLNN
jgi:hypothetical protein